MRALAFLFFAFLLSGCGKGGVAEDRALAETSAKSPVAAPSAVLAKNEGVFVPRLVMRDAELSVRVADVRKAEARVGEIARGEGGYVEASQGADLAGPNPSLSLTLRVPESRFESAITELEGLGTRLGKTIATEDVTSQVVDLDARLKSLRVQEGAYRAILASARKIADVLEVQERLVGVRTEIEQIVAQRRTLGDRAARSKIVVDLTQASRPESPAPEPDWMAQTWGEATGTLRGLGRAFASLGLWAVALLPIWLPVGFAGALIVRASRGRRA